MRIIGCFFVSYFLGSISPSYFLSRIKKKNFREQGTGNLGATNTMVILGKQYGIFVMIIDFLKGFIAVKLAKAVAPEIPAIWLSSGLFAVLGHIFPFYLKFKGGKGLATFGGVVLAYDAVAFSVLLTVSIALMFIFDYGTAMPISGALLFPLFALSEGIGTFLISCTVGFLVISKHWSNVKKAKNGEDTKVREYIKRYIK